MFRCFSLLLRIFISDWEGSAGMVYHCPTCGDVFDSRRGLGVHQSVTHDERLPNRRCDHCGEEFYCDYERTYCSEDCLQDGQSFEGSSNPNYQGKKETTTCTSCGEQFDYYPSEKEGLYCGECVDGGSWRDPPALEGEDNPQWGGGKESVPCSVCGESVERYPNSARDGAVLCSDDCRGRWLSENFSGSDHPNWDGGGIDTYGPGWSRVKRRALERDDYECVVCGATKAELDRNPDVHHLLPVRLFAEAERLNVSDAHYLENVVSLCPRCHRNVESGDLTPAALRSLIDDS